MVPILLAVTAAPANADWLGLPGLSAPGADWVREYTTAVPPTTIYASTEGDGVYRSVNNGLTWSPFSAGLDTVPGAMNVRTVYTSGTTAYAGTSSGLFKSVAGGAWTPLAQGAEEDPKQPKKLNRAVQTIYSPLVGKMLAGVAGGGVYSSPDNGVSWQPPAPGNGMASAETVWSIGSLVPGVLFAATGSGVYRSLDNGSTWTLASDGITSTILRVFADEKAPTIFYASGTDGVFRTINGGITWSDAGGPPGHQLPGGAVRALQQFSGVDETRLYAGTTDGVYAGTTGHGLLPGPIRWRKVENTGLGNNTIIWALKSFTTTPGVLWAGTQSNGGYGLIFTPPVNTAAPAVAGDAQVAVEPSRRPTASGRARRRSSTSTSGSAAPTRRLRCTLDIPEAQPGRLRRHPGRQELLQAPLGRDGQQLLPARSASSTGKSLPTAVVIFRRGLDRRRVAAPPPADRQRRGQRPAAARQAPDGQSADDVHSRGRQGVHVPLVPL